MPPSYSQDGQPLAIETPLGKDKLLLEAVNGVIDQLRRGQDARLRIEGFASGEDANRARRLSLSRALAVRAFLMDEGLSSTRMDVYARGSQAEGGPSDRVDLNVFRR